MMKLQNTEQGIWDQSSIKNLSRSSRILAPVLWTVLFNSAHSFFQWGFGQGTGTAMPKWSLNIFIQFYSFLFIIWSLNNFCVDIDIWFGSLSYWKFQLWPSSNLLKDVMYPNKLPRALQHRRLSSKLNSGD